jgi:hypothetical protein
MKKLYLLLLFALLCSTAAMSQNVRYRAEWPSVSSNFPPVLVANLPPNSPTIAVCHSPANAVPCSNYATTYTGAGAACPNGAQDTPDPNALTSACQPTGDATGNVGFWAPAGTYDYTVCIQNNCFGPITVTLGGSGGGGGGSPGGSNTQLQFNNAGAFGGISGWTTDGTANIFGSILNHIVFVDRQAGATADLQIAACVAALIGNSGICDARGYGYSQQTIASCPVNIGGTGQSVGLLINPATTFNITCSAASDYAFHVYPGSYIRGDGTGAWGFANQEANFVATTASLKGIISNWPRITTGNASVMSISNVMLESLNTSTITEGLYSLSGVFSGTTISNSGSVSCAGGGASLYITSPTSGAITLTSDLTFVNDNFDCGGAAGSGHAIEIISHSATSGAGSINFFGSQAQHSALSEVDINGNGDAQCSSYYFSGFHTESSTFGTVPPHVTINDCHNITFDNWNLSGPAPTSGNAMTVAQATTNATHDIFIRASRFLSGYTNIVSSSVSGLTGLPFSAQADGAMSVEYWAGLPLHPGFATSASSPLLENCAPDTSGFSGYSVAGLTNYQYGHWEYTFGQTSAIYCTVFIPAAQTGATLVLDIAANDGTAGHTANFQTCDGVINAGTINIGALTCAANQAFTTTSTAYNRVTLTFNVQSTLSNNSILVVKIATSTTGTAPTANLLVAPHFIL